MAELDYRFLRITVKQNSGSPKLLFATVSKATMEKINEDIADPSVQLLRIPSKNGQTLYINKSDLNHIMEGDFDENMVGNSKPAH